MIRFTAYRPQSTAGFTASITTRLLPSFGFKQSSQGRRLCYQDDAYCIQAGMSYVETPPVLMEMRTRKKAFAR